MDLQRYTNSISCVFEERWINRSYICSLFLPPDSIIATHREIGGMSLSNFPQWLTNIQHLTQNGCEVLLSYDASRSHLSLKWLSILKNGGVEAYELPSHTSEHTQSLYLSGFGTFKIAINERLHAVMTGRRAEAATRGNTSRKLSIYDLCVVFRTAYDESFNRANIVPDLKKKNYHRSIRKNCSNTHSRRATTILRQYSTQRK